MNKLNRPLLSVCAIFLLCLVLRSGEYFLLRTDQTVLGEALFHKLAGIVILFAAARLLSATPEFLGFAKRGAVRYTAMGLLFGLSVFAVAYGAEILLAVSQGRFQSLRLYVSVYSVDGNMGYQTGALFFLLCIAGNVANVLMEEGIFRGLFQKMLQQKYTFLASASIASLLFGLWHVVGPLRSYHDGLSSMGGMAANLLMLVVTSGLGGLKFALLTKLTGSLYMAMGDHFVNNTIVNVLHVASFTGADEWMVARITIAQTLSCLIVFLVYYIKRKRA